MDWCSYFLGIISLVLAEAFLFFIFPILQVPRDKFKAWFFKKRKIKTRRDKDRKRLDDIRAPLRGINQYPNFPGTPIDTIKGYLFEIERIAEEIKTKDFREIKDKLLKYSAKVDELHQNIDSREIAELLIKCEDCSLGLYQEIGEILSQTKKKKKAQNEASGARGSQAPYK